MEPGRRAGRADPGWIEDELGNERVNYRGTSARLSGYAEFGSNPYGICDLLGNAYDLCLGSEPGLDGEQVLWACGGASWSPREELGRSLRMSGAPVGPIPDSVVSAQNPSGTSQQGIAYDARSSPRRAG